jgi:DNA-binding response OmpR family regulator
MMLDLSLPDRDGIEFLTTLKGIGFNGKLILMSSQPRNVIDMAATLATAQGMAPALTMLQTDHA